MWDFFHQAVLLGIPRGYTNWTREFPFASLKAMERWLEFDFRDRFGAFCYATPAIGNGSGHPVDPGSSASWTILARLRSSWSYNQSFLTTLWHIIAIHLYISVYINPESHYFSMILLYHNLSSPFPMSHIPSRSLRLSDPP